MYSAQHSTHPTAPTPTWSNCQWAKPSSGEPFSLTPLSHGLSEGSPPGAVTTLRAAHGRYNGVIRKLKCAGRVQVISLLEFPILDVMDMWDNRTKESQKLLWIELKEYFAVSYTGLLQCYVLSRKTASRRFIRYHVKFQHKPDYANNWELSRF